MMYWILFVLPKSEYLNDVMAAWEEAGVTGITILPSVGAAGWKQKNALRDDLPLIPELEDFQEHKETTSHTLFTLVGSEELADKVVAATQKITGDLNLPNTGILAVLPVLKVYGLDRHDPPADVNSPQK
jgi:nitrogen regulatory protein P-II 1